jgi:hypothetical protein
MTSLKEIMDEYKKQLDRGIIQQAYVGLMEYFGKLRAYLKKKYPKHVITGIYYGYMDMTYFQFTPESLAKKKLKIAIVFLHDEFRFEVWLAAANKNIQTKYWELVKEKGWNKYRIPTSIKGYDSIVEYILEPSPNFDDLDSLTKCIKEGTLKFTKDVEAFLLENSI